MSARAFDGPFVLVTGGKGGVGKSTLAANLAVELTRSGARTLLADLDLGLANLDVILGLRAERTVADFLSGDASLASCVVQGPNGLDLLPGGSGVPSLANLATEQRARLLSGLGELSGDYDVVVGDTAAGIGPDVLDLAGAADRVLVVTTPDPAAVTDAYGVLKALDLSASSAGRELPTPEIVVNLVSGTQEARRVAGTIQTTCERFLSRSPRLAGWLPRARGVVAASSTREPFVTAFPKSLAARSIVRLADRMRRFLPPLAAAGPSSSF
jgi:flagellar biosynthesis protein FlhG